MNVGALSVGLAGLQAADARVTQAAQETYEATLPTDQISISSQDPLIQAQTDQITADLSYRASIKTIQTAQQMDETLLQLFTR